MYILLL